MKIVHVGLGEGWWGPGGGLYLEGTLFDQAPCQSFAWILRCVGDGENSSLWFSTAGPG